MKGKKGQHEGSEGLKGIPGLQPCLGTEGAEEAQARGRGPHALPGMTSVCLPAAAAHQALSSRLLLWLVFP